MHTFRYLAKMRATGAVVEGDVQAVNGADARFQLGGQGFDVLSLRPVRLEADAALEPNPVDPWKVRRRATVSLMLGLAAVVLAYILPMAFLHGVSLVPLISTLAGNALAAFAIMVGAAQLVAIRRHRLGAAGGGFAIAGIAVGALVISSTLLLTGWELFRQTFG